MGDKSSHCSLALHVSEAEQGLGKSACMQACKQAPPEYDKESLNPAKLEVFFYTMVRCNTTRKQVVVCRLSKSITFHAFKHCPLVMEHAGDLLQVLKCI